MDKYEFNIKVEQIKKLVNKGDFETGDEDRRYHRLASCTQHQPGLR